VRQHDHGRVLRRAAVAVPGAPHGAPPRLDPNTQGPNPSLVDQVAVCRLRGCTSGSASASRGAGRTRSRRGGVEAARGSAAWRG
jgi:hypothetical protein